MFLIRPNLGPFLHILGPSGLFLRLLSGSKSNFGNGLFRQSTLVLDMQPHLFDFNLPKFGAFFALFGPFGAIFGVGFKFKNFLGPSQ